MPRSSRLTCPSASRSCTVWYTVFSEIVGISSRAALVERVDGRVPVVAVQQAEDRLALRRDPQALVPEELGELVGRLHRPGTLSTTIVVSKLVVDK